MTLSYEKPGKQIVAFLLILLFSFVIFSGIGIVSAIIIYGSGVISNLNDFNDPQVVAAMRYLQGFVHAGMFLIPAVAFAIFSGRNWLKYLNANSFTDFHVVLVSILLLIFSAPLIGQLMEWNMNMTMPEWLSGVEQWMRDSEEKAKIMTEAFLNTTSVSTLMVNLLIMAVLPAIGEEFVFRAFLMRWFSSFIKNIHLNIFIVSVLFSAIHMQFFGFLPRFALGMILGYVFYYSGTIWLPILLHFINNSITVIVYYQYNNGAISTSPEDFGSTNNIYITIFSFVTVISGLYLLSKISKRHPEMP